MKKIVLSMMTVALAALLLAGCGEKKSSEVTAAEQAITDIGTVTLDSADAIENAETLYDALSSEDQEKVENAAALDEARETYDALVDESLNAFLDKITQMNTALDEMDIPLVYTMIADMRTELSSMNEDLYAAVSEATTTEDGTLEEQMESWEAILEQICIGDSQLAAPPYVVSVTSDGYTPVDNGNGFVAYNTYFTSVSAAEQAYDEYKTYLSQYGTISNEEDSGDEQTCVFTGESGQEWTIRLSDHGEMAVLQVRVPNA